MTFLSMSSRSGSKSMPAIPTQELPMTEQSKAILSPLRRRQHTVQRLHTSTDVPRPPRRSARWLGHLKQQLSTRRVASESGAMANTIVWPSGVRTFTRWVVRSTSVTVARTFPSTSLPLMSPDDWEGTRTVTACPFQSREWYVVLAPSTATIVARGSRDAVGSPERTGWCSLAMSPPTASRPSPREGGKSDETSVILLDS